MSFSLDDTIAAIASASGPALRGLIRISGAQAVDVARRALEPVDADLGGRRASMSSQALRLGDATVPVSLMLWPTRRSFTGEPVAELHLIGAPPLLDAVLERTLMSGARPAEPGEFTLRAFLAGRLDLVQAEAVLGVIDAHSVTELQTALGQLAGGISGEIGQLREQLLIDLADLEAGLDFVEEDIDFVARPEFAGRLETAQGVVRRILNQADSRMQTTGRFRVALAGLPNAGKSTLFNLLAGRDAALVSDRAGTTRDYLVVAQSDAGASWDLVDTAGWEDAETGVDVSASLLRDEQYRRADLLVWCTASDLDAADLALNAARLSNARDRFPNVIEIQTKGDLAGGTDVEGRLAVSAASGMGVDELKKRIAGSLSTAGSRSEIISTTAARCSESLRHALASLERAHALANAGAGDELIAMELREALDDLGRMTGRIYTDDILDRIFSRFCIGK